MRAIVQYIREYLRATWNRRLFSSVGLLLLVGFGINYSFDFETSIVRRLSSPAEQAGFFYLFYSLPYLLTLALWAWANDRWNIFRQKEFWVLFQLCFITLAVYVALHNVPGYLLQTQTDLFAHIPSAMRLYLVRYASNLLPGIVTAAPIVVYWYRRDRGESRVYGFSASNIRLQTYVAILLALTPIILAASFTSDFRDAYPRYKFGLPADLLQPEKSFWVAMFQFCYGVDFVFVEFFFRGFMVMAFARFLGSGSILPMVVVYAMLHFQKPLGEALGSVFGGLVLGIISYNTKSIYGGILLHLGVAYLMELAGSIQFIV